MPRSRPSLLGSGGPREVTRNPLASLGWHEGWIFAEENRKWLTLASVSFGLFMIMLDNTVVNVALPSIQRPERRPLRARVDRDGLRPDLRVADARRRQGRRRVRAAAHLHRRNRRLHVRVPDLRSRGLVGDAHRRARAPGRRGRADEPATLSIIAATFPPRERGTAIGIWAGTSALALAIGPLVGGLITEHIDWSWIFFVNVPVGALAIASVFFIDESRDETHERLDLPGLITSALGLFALTYGLIEANTYGWGSARSSASSCWRASPYCLHRTREAAACAHASARALPNRTYTGANLVMLLVALAMFGVFFFVSLYMQNVLGYSAVQTGAAFLPMTVLIILVAPIAGKTSDRVGSRGLITGGMTLLAVQLLLFSQLSADASFWNLLPALLIGGVGMALTMTPSAAAATRSLPVDKAGVGSAVLNSARQVGGTMGVAIMGAIVAAEVGDVPTPDAFMRGFERALLVAAGIAIAGAIVAYVLIRPHEEAGRRTEQRPTAEPVAK